MNRWWDSPKKAVEVLSSVDGSDAVQGVGTAILGYHALSQAFLKPLSSKTLVDVQELLNAANLIDTEPVSKAVAEAVRPMLDSAADRYGEMFAEDLHWRAKDSLERLVLSWTAGGMPWPTAIERASEVYGVPIEKLGKYAHQMKGAVNPLVRQDTADRVLMEYASEKGKLESETVNKSLMGAELIEFNRERKRDENGRFARKPLTPDERKKRRDSRNRRLQVSEDSKKLTVARKATVNEARNQVEELMRVFSEPRRVAERQTVGRQTVGRRVVERRTVGRQVAPARVVEQKVALKAKETKKDSLKNKYDGLYREAQESYIVGTVDDLKVLRATGSLPKNKHTAFSAEQVNNMVDNSLIDAEGRKQLSKIVLFRVRDIPVVDGGLNTPDGAIIPSEANLTSSNKPVFRTEFNELSNQYKDKTWANSGVSVNTVDIFVGNEDEFFGKNLTGAELIEFNRERRRDEIGRFAAGGGGNSRKERRERRERRLRRLEANRPATKVSSIEVKNDVDALNSTAQQIYDRKVLPRKRAERLSVGRQTVGRKSAGRQTVGRRKVSELTSNIKATKNANSDVVQQKFANDQLTFVAQTEPVNSPFNKFVNKKSMIVNNGTFAEVFDIYPADLAMPDFDRQVFQPVNDVKLLGKIRPLGDAFDEIRGATEITPDYVTYHDSEESSENETRIQLAASGYPITSNVSFSTEELYSTNPIDGSLEQTGEFTTRAFENGLGKTDAIRNNFSLMVFDSPAAQKAFENRQGVKMTLNYVSPTEMAENEDVPSGLIDYAKVISDIKDELVVITVSI
jgi:hypothetical protein